MPADMNDYFKNTKRPSGGDGGGNGPQMPKMPKIDFGGKMWIVYLLIAVVVLFLFTKPFVIIDEGERGIKVTTGKYEPEAMIPGLHFIMPIIQKVIIVDTKVRIVNFKKVQDRTADSAGIMVNPPVTVLDKRGLPVSIELTVQYQLNQRFASQTIATWGLSWEEKIINPVVRDIVRNTIGKYEAETLPNRRNEIAIEIEKELMANVHGLENQPVILHSVQLREIGLPEKVREQIERVQLAKQEVERAQQEVERAKQVAFQQQEAARGVAEARKIEAAGVAESKKIEAEGIAKANDLVARSLTRNLLELEQMKVQSEFNQALQVNKDAKIFLTPGGSTPNIWVDMKNPQQRTSTAQ
ncbi:MAG: membrane protein [Sulfurovum sp. PC08-66]|nr:MAG: membrane protein [Sulfurovum sp. PC08-66]KIM12561.1 MAG: membrane protein [Sulfuricurvum sp. PC08-66]